VGLLVAIFTTVGIPPFGEFPIRYELLSELSKLSLSIAMAVLVGMGGLFLTAMRVMVAFASNASAEWKIQEKPGEIALLAVAVVALILIGLFPHVFLSRLAVLLQAFTSLK
jgi:formate hydrogenlyase subunit 3/multisubunit Na+/H+ antiporter MnhD subunit